MITGTIDPTTLAYLIDKFGFPIGIVKVTSYATVAGSNVQSSWEGILVINPT